MAVLTNPITGELTTAMSVHDVYNLAYKFLESYMSGADIEFKYDELNRAYKEWGAIIETARFPATESTTVNKNTTSKVAPNYPAPKVRYYQDWTEKCYRADIRRIDADKVLSGEMEFEAFLAKVINANIEGYKLDVNKAMKNAFGITASSITSATPYAEIIISTATATAPAVSTDTKSVLGAAGLYENLNGATFAQVFTEMQKISKDMTYDNSTYTPNFVCGAAMDDLCVIMPSEFAAAAGVEFLSKLYNMEEAKKIPMVIETDGLAFDYTNAQNQAKTKCVILVQDKRYLNHWERYREEITSYDRDRFSQGYDLHIEDAVTINPLYKAYAIVFDLPTA